MEFLACPSNPLGHGELKVLPIFSNTGYDGGPFLEYLDRHPGTIFTGDRTKLIYLSELEVHYQNWLFFGLLQELLGDLFDERDFILTNTELGTSRITTRNLRDILQQWDEERLANMEEAQLVKFRKCLEEVWRTLELTDRSFPDHGERLGLQVDVIAAVAEILTTVLQSRHENFSPRRENSDLPCDWLAVSYQGRSTVLQSCAKKMVDVGGWCLNDIQMGLERFKTFESWHYLRHLRLRTDTQLHQDCDMISCKIVTSNNSTMIPKHVSRDCRCESVSLSNRRLTQIYQQGYMPCLKISRKRTNSTPLDRNDEDGLNIKVRLHRLSFKMKSNIQYAATSHVWGDGTGNGHANGLPLCQLRRLYDCFQSEGETETEGAQLDSESSSVIVWIDTMCCPYQQGPGKRLALANMKQIYQHATTVHILDSSLLSWSFQGDFLEIGTRLLYTGWMRRLWTAQEAIFSGLMPEDSLIVHCQNGKISLTSIYRRLYHEMELGNTFYESLAFEIMRLEKAFWPGVGGHNFQVIGLAAKLLQYRSTSVSTDEPLVLANILGFPNEEFIGLSHEEGMCKFWSTIVIFGEEELQKGIPFCPTPKLITKGFRWAPRTLMNPDKYLPDAYFNAKENPSWHAELTLQGLVASFRGFKVVPHAKPTPRCLLGGDVNSCLQNYDRISFGLKDGTWLRFGDSVHSGRDYEMAFTRMYERLRRGSLVFVSQRAEIPEEPVVTHGIIGEYIDEKDGIVGMVIDHCVSIDKHRQYPAELHSAAKKCALEILELLDGNYEKSFEDADEGLDELVQRVFEEHVRETLLDDAALCDTVRSNSRENLNAKRNWTFDQVLEEFKGRVHYHAHVGAVDVLEYPEETKWCLD